MKETQLCYCDTCDKAINFNCRLGHTISKSHIHKKEYGIVVREYEFIRPQIGEVKYIFNDTIKDCINIFIHLNIDVYTILNQKILKIRKKLF